MVFSRIVSSNLLIVVNTSNISLDRFQKLIIDGNEEDKHQYVRPNTNLNFPVISVFRSCHNFTIRAS